MSLRKQTLISKLPPITPSKPSSFERVRRFSQKRDYGPRSWKKYFDSADDIVLDNGNSFRVYRCGNQGPLVLLLHGGGYSALTWSLFTESVLTMVDCRIAAIDLRGHGCTKCAQEEDLSADTLSKDIGDVIIAMFPKEEVPNTVTIGHSMGGALAVHVAFGKCIPSLIGMIVIDVVEGTAMDALYSMQSFLRGRPSVFKTIENAIEWCVRSGQVRNVQSARVSMPGQIMNVNTGILAAKEIEDGHISSSSNSFEDHTNVTSSDSILEEDESVTSPKEEEMPKSSSEEFKKPNATEITPQYTWRINLSKSEKFWTGWFSGLSKMFLSCDVPTMLLLAGVDRLDKELTVGQMQGKFQMQVLPMCGHAVHEDVPDRVAEVVATFLVRHKFAEAKSDFHTMMPAC